MAQAGGNCEFSATESEQEAQKKKKIRLQSSSSEESQVESILFLLISNDC